MKKHPLDLWQKELWPDGPRRCWFCIISLGVALGTVIYLWLHLIAYWLRH